MTTERADSVHDDPNAQLETALIDEFLHTRGLDREGILTEPALG